MFSRGYFVTILGTLSESFINNWLFITLLFWFKKKCQRKVSGFNEEICSVLLCEIVQATTQRDEPDQKPNKNNKRPIRGVI